MAPLTPLKVLTRFYDAGRDFAPVAAVLSKDIYIFSDLIVP